jgi:protocatechuate 3,4-dioxygenase beta subunit
MIKPRTFPTLLFLVAILGTAGHVQARVETGTMEGTVLDSRGRPVADATVTMQTSDGSRPYATHTDARGHFQFMRYETGQYDLQAYSRGMFSNWTKRISIHTGKKTSVTLRLPPPADISVSVSK